jgi:hypothetical protein
VVGAVVGTAVDVVRALPALVTLQTQSRRVTPGQGAVAVTVVGPGPGPETAATFVALPGGPFVTPFGPLWFDLANVILLEVATVNGLHTLQLPVGADVPLGLPVALQSLVVGTAGARLTNASVTVLD